ncbi:uncharacterized protein KY384_001603 [Bacidia gigantensis]|uniref:uncharacterized protein n=1 Tax=Bacidia gigantensis TaxID=2732470 RepID=UPI001D04FAC6|nr:uncharacterized protein KY384_001603 [Bacidia gigantensis]KAG8533862.1 hypothetical protein KY384_001603 [Bacidia gigantensis]
MATLSPIHADKQQAMYIIVIFSIWVQCLWGNNYVTPDDVVDWTPNDFHWAIEGAKWGVAMEVCKVSTVWGCKACLLILYAAMTKGLPKYRKAVWAVAIYVAVGYVIVMFCYFLAWCKPFSAYYDTIPLPPDQSECMTYRHHMILDACFNITSDAIMLCLPIPLVIKAKVPLKRKLVLVSVFGLGALVILCAILNRVTNFTAPYGSLVYLNWYAGETATAVIVANVPHLWALISRVFRLGTFKDTSAQKGSNQYPLRSHRSNAHIVSARRTKFDVDGYIPTGSEERIATTGVKDPEWGYTKKMESDSSNEDLEYGSGYTTTHVKGGGKDGNTGVSVREQELGGWENDHPESNRSGAIVKTVQMNQYTSNQ